MALAHHLYPQLRALTPGERAQALRAARRRPFDILELLGMAAGLVAAALFIRHGLASMLPAGGLLERAAIGALALAAVIGPFLVRRTRRGLQEVVGPHEARR